MLVNRMGLTLLGILSAAIVFAAPAQSQVVKQYTATLVSGFGDGPAITGGDLGPDTANNGFPACAANILGPQDSAVDATVTFSGSASIATTGPAPRAIAFQTATANNGLMTTCYSVQTKIPPFLTIRIQSSNLTWPGTAGSFAAGGGFAGTTGAPFVHIGSFNSLQKVLATTVPLPGPSPSPKFGGSLRVNGVSNAFLGIQTAVNVFTGTLPVRLSMGRGGTTGPTFLTSTAQPFQVKGGLPPTISATVPQEFFPWTTGRIMVSDKDGNFWTFRTKTGFDNRNAAGTSGTIQLVAPMLTAVTGSLLDIPFAPTSVLTITFAPEPGATLLLAGGALTLLLLFAWRRRAN